jgi:predicted DNA-binding WGR domain protein
MQIVEKNAGGFAFIQHWGRVGAKGQCKVDNFSDAAGAVKALEKKFKTKSGIKFSERNSASAVGGKYKMMQLRLNSAGAKSGDVAVSLMWDNTRGERHDLDLHVVCPSGQEIYYGNRRSGCGGELDVDRMSGTDNAVENTVWVGKPPSGQYKVYVKNYSGSSCTKPMPYTVRININGKHEHIERSIVGSSTKDLVKTFNF